MREREAKSIASQQYSRRRVLQNSAAAGVAVSTALFSPGSAWAQSLNFGSNANSQPLEPPAGEIPFLHGVASGDPLSNSVILWTRITPDENALPGSGNGEPTEVLWEVAADEGFGSVVATGTITTDPESDHTVHVEPQGLEPSTVYFYRFTVAGGPHKGKQSPVGRTKTAPAPGAALDQLNFAVASCANWESGFFTAYADMANRGRAGDLDLTVFLGDYLYEYAAGEYAGNGPVRDHHPAHEITTLADYRTRYGRYRTDPNLQNAHAALPWIVVWDDHEVANDTWRGGAENHQPESEGDYLSRRDAAMQAYFEWLPVRATSPSEQGHIYRSFTFGDLAEITMMDLRTYRDVQETWNPAKYAEEDRTMLGSEQYNWLVNQVDTSTTAWNVLGNSVMFSPMNLITLEENPQTAPISSALSTNVTGIPLNGDQWDGYSAERRRLLRTLDGAQATPLFVTGDIHTEWAHSVMYEGREIGAELVCASISAPNINEQLKLPEGNAISALGERILNAANPHTRHVNLDHHGYSFIRLTRDAAEMHWLRVDNLVQPDTAVREAVVLTWQKGAGFTF